MKAHLFNDWIISAIIDITSADEVDAHEEEHQASHEEFRKFSIVLLVLADGHEQDDDSERAEDSCEEGVFGEVVSHYDAVEKLHADD
jgi:hypothetical protein